eukprot:UN26907
MVGNPKDPNNMTEAQKKISAGFKIENASEFYLGYQNMNAGRSCFLYSATKELLSSPICFECVTVECPCEGEQRAYWFADDDGCSACDCEPCPMCDECPEGEMSVEGLPDDDGCPTCSCEPEPCPTPDCSCPSGQTPVVPLPTDDRGCETCECEDVDCSLFAPLCVCGLDEMKETGVDEHGCDTCECVKNPC